MIQGNIFLGIIVDTFADLRDHNNTYEDDKKNICFICQLQRDDSLNKNIDFEKHIEHDHFPWKYVFFLTYLYTNNSNDFNAPQFMVWKKLNLNDVSWIPIAENLV
jgi:hypothetical protein